MATLKLQLNRDDLLSDSTYTTPSFTETAVGDGWKVEFKDGGTPVSNGTVNFAAALEDAYATIRENLVNSSNGFVAFRLTATQMNALTGVVHGVEVHNITTGNMNCYHQGEWISNDSNTYEDAITASTTQTQGQQPLTAKLNTVSTVANSDDVVTMPAAVAGTIVYLSNSGLNTLKVFPASGDNFVGESANDSITISVSAMRVFFTTNTNEWGYSQ